MISGKVKNEFISSFKIADNYLFDSQFPQSHQHMHRYSLKDQLQEYKWLHSDRVQHHMDWPLIKKKWHDMVKYKYHTTPKMSKLEDEGKELSVNFTFFSPSLHVYVSHYIILQYYSGTKLLIISSHSLPPSFVFKTVIKEV